MENPLVMFITYRLDRDPKKVTIMKKINIAVILFGMKKRALLSFTLGLVLASNSFAGLPTPSTQNRTTMTTGNNGYGNVPYGQGQGNGASYYPNNYQPGYNQYQQPPQNRQTGGSVQKINQTVQTGGDLLWLFTGSEGSVREQMKNGFHSSGDSTFGGRLLNLFLGMMYGKFLAPVSDRLGSVGDKFLQPGSGTSITKSGNPYQGQGANYCYQCAMQNQTNPYARNPQAVPPQIFNSGSSSAGSGGASAGGIRR